MEYAQMEPEELNIAIAEKVMGWTVFRTDHNGYELDADEVAYGFPPDKSVDGVPFDIQDYLTWQGMGMVIEAMRANGWYFDCECGEIGYFARFRLDDFVIETMTWAKELPRAVALAALSALSEEVQAHAIAKTPTA